MTKAEFERLMQEAKENFTKKMEEAQTYEEKVNVAVACATYMNTTIQAYNQQKEN